MSGAGGESELLFPSSCVQAKLLRQHTPTYTNTHTHTPEQTCACVLG